MFGDRGPLRQEAEDTRLPSIPFRGGEEQPVRTQRGGMSGAFGSGGRATEAPPAEPEPATWGTGASQPGGGRGEVTGAPLGPRTGGAGTGWRGSIQLGPGVAADTALAIRAREDRINQQQTLQNLVDMRASGFTRDQMLQWAQLNDQDAEAAQQLANYHFPRIRQQIQDLNNKVDAARAGKIDPYHWHESIGRGGRVAAAFAALTGGFAAGKSNPNSALNMLDAAIARDIAAQDANIKNNIMLLQTERGLAQDERQLLEDEFKQLSQIRAMKYAAIVGRIEAAQQHAVTEAHHMSLQTAKDHYELKYLEAKAQAEQEIFKLEYDGPIKNAAQIAKLKQQAAQYQQMIRSAPSGGMTIPTEMVQTLEGEVVGPRPEAQIMVAPAPGRSGAIAARRPGTGRVVAPGGPGTGETQQPAPEPTRPAPSRELQPIEDVGTGVSRLETPEEAEQRYMNERAVWEEEQRAAELERRKAEVTASRYKINAKNIRQYAESVLLAHEDAVKFDGFKRGEAVGKRGLDSLVGLTSWSEAISAIQSGRAIPNGGMPDYRDAKIISGVIEENGPPSPLMYAGGERNIHYQEALKRYQLTIDYPEILEKNMFDPETGEKSKIRLNGRLLTIMPGSRAGKDYERVQNEVGKFRDVMGAMQRAAKTIRNVGITGMWETDPETGKTSFTFPGVFTNANPEIMMIQREAITQAMQYIKTHDPTARISDQDLRVGMEAAASYTGKGAAFVDWLQSMFNVSTKRDQIQAFMGKVLVEAQRIMYSRLEDDIVPDYNTMIALEQEYKANDKFLRKAQVRE